MKTKLTKKTLLNFVSEKAKTELAIAEKAKFLMEEAKNNNNDKSVNCMADHIIEHTTRANELNELFKMFNEYFCDDEEE